MRVFHNQKHALAFRCLHYVLAVLMTLPTFSGSFVHAQTTLSMPASALLSFPSSSPVLDASLIQNEDDASVLRRVGYMATTWWVYHQLAWQAGWFHAPMHGFYAEQPQLAEDLLSPIQFLDDQTYWSIIEQVTQNSTHRFVLRYPAGVSNKEALSNRRELLSDFSGFMLTDYSFQESWFAIEINGVRIEEPKASRIKSATVNKATLTQAFAQSFTAIETNIQTASLQTGPARYQQGLLRLYLANVLINLLNLDEHRIPASMMAEVDDPDDDRLSTKEVAAVSLGTPYDRLENLLLSQELVEGGYEKFEAYRVAALLKVEAEHEPFLLERAYEGTITSLLNELGITDSERQQSWLDKLIHRAALQGEVAVNEWLGQIREEHERVKLERETTLFQNADRTRNQAIEDYQRATEEYQLAVVLAYVIKASAMKPMAATAFLRVLREGVSEKSVATMSARLDAEDWDQYEQAFREYHSADTDVLYAARNVLEQILDEQSAQFFVGSVGESVFKRLLEESNNRPAKIKIATPLRQYTQTLSEVTIVGYTLAEALAHLVRQYPELLQHLFFDPYTSSPEHDIEGRPKVVVEGITYALRPFVNIFIDDQDVTLDPQGLNALMVANAELRILTTTVSGQDAEELPPLHFGSTEGYVHTAIAYAHGMAKEGHYLDAAAEIIEALWTAEDPEPVVNIKAALVILQRAQELADEQGVNVDLGMYIELLGEYSNKDDDTPLFEQFSRMRDIPSIPRPTTDPYNKAPYPTEVSARAELKRRSLKGLQNTYSHLIDIHNQGNVPLSVAANRFNISLPTKPEKRPNDALREMLYKESGLVEEGEIPLNLVLEDYALGSRIFIYQVFRDVLPEEWHDGIEVLPTRWPPGFAYTLAEGTSEEIVLVVRIAANGIATLTVDEEDIDRLIEYYASRGTSIRRRLNEDNISSVSTLNPSHEVPVVKHNFNDYFRGASTTGAILDDYLEGIEYTGLDSAQKLIDTIQSKADQYQPFFLRLHQGELVWAFDATNMDIEAYAALGLTPRSAVDALEKASQYPDEIPAMADELNEVYRGKAGDLVKKFDALVPVQDWEKIHPGETTYVVEKEVDGVWIRVEFNIRLNERNERVATFSNDAETIRHVGLLLGYFWVKDLAFVEDIVPMKLDPASGEYVKNEQAISGRAIDSLFSAQGIAVAKNINDALPDTNTLAGIQAFNANEGKGYLHEGVYYQLKWSEEGNKLVPSFKYADRFKVARSFGYVLYEEEFLTMPEEDINVMTEWVVFPSNSITKTFMGKAKRASDILIEVFGLPDKVHFEAYPYTINIDGIDVEFSLRRRSGENRRKDFFIAFHRKHLPLIENYLASLGSDQQLRVRPEAYYEDKGAADSRDVESTDTEIQSLEQSDNPFDLEDLDNCSACPLSAKAAANEDKLLALESVITKRMPAYIAQLIANSETPLSEDAAIELAIEHMRQKLIEAGLPADASQSAAEIFAQRADLVQEQQESESLRAKIAAAVATLLRQLLSQMVSSDVAQIQAVADSILEDEINNLLEDMVDDEPAQSPEYLIAAWRKAATAA